MPIFDFKCPVCRKIEKDVFVHHWDDPVFCKRCDVYKQRMEKIPSIMSPHVFPAEGIFLEHVSPEGKRFFSKQEMKDYARKNDLEIGYLE